MANFFIDTRELRSFRFKYHTSDLSLVLQQKTSTVGICVTNSFNPEDRQIWRENKINKELTITAIPNQIGRFLFNDKDNQWTNVRNLFKGQVFLIKNKTNKKLTIDLLKQFLSFKKFYLRLLFLNDQLYRANVITSVSTNNLVEKAALITVVAFLTHKINNVIYVTTIPQIVAKTKE